MIEIRNALAYRIWSNMIALIIGILGIIVGLFLTVLINYEPIPFLLPMIYIIALAFFLFWLMKKLEKRFKCPQCGGQVEDYHREHCLEGDKLLKLCQHCNILWHIGTV